MDYIDQRVAIVTGGARGIGAAVTTTLARAGYHVAAGYSTVDKTVRRMTVKGWHAVLRVNVSGAFYMIQAVL